MKEEFYTDGEKLFCFFTHDRIDYHGLETITGHKTFAIQSLEYELERLRGAYRIALGNSEKGQVVNIAARGKKISGQIAKIKAQFYDDFQDFADAKLLKSEMAYKWQGHCSSDIKLINLRYVTYCFRRDIAYLLQFSDYNPGLNFTKIEVEGEKVTP